MQVRFDVFLIQHNKGLDLNLGTPGYSKSSKLSNHLCPAVCVEMMIPSVTSFHRARVYLIL